MPICVGTMALLHCTDKPFRPILVEQRELTVELNNHRVKVLTYMFLLLQNDNISGFGSHDNKPKYSLGGYVYTYILCQTGLASNHMHRNTASYI